MTNDTVQFLAPDVGTRFDYDGVSYHVDGWLKERAPPPPYKGQSVVCQIIDEMLYQTQPEIGPKNRKLRWCFRQDATHVAGSGVGGCVAPIEAITVTGRVNWSPDVIAEAVVQANHMAARGLNFN